MNRFSAAVAVAALSLSASTAAAQQGGAGPAAIVDAVNDGDWDRAYALATPEGAVARDVVTWEKLLDGDGSFEDYTVFLAQHPTWPRLERLREKAELSIPKGLPSGQVLTFFGNNLPETGQGAVRLAEALLAEGRVDSAHQALETAWLTLGLDAPAQAAMLDTFPDILAPHHAARVDAMLWRWRTSDAERLLGKLGRNDRLMAEARIALIRDTGDAARKLAAVPGSLRNTPGIANARFNRFASRGDYTEAIAIIKDHTGSAERLGEPFRWASWRASLARWLMREGRPDEAYALASQHHMTEGPLWADLEWLSGYLALTYEKNPTRALEHFQRLEADVESPISLARAGYWQGRAREALGLPDVAALDYARAALHQTAFYGLLAAEKLGLALDPALTGREAVGDWRAGAMLTDDRAQALQLLLAGGDRGGAVQFAAALGRSFERSDLARLGAMLVERDEPFLALLVGKTAAARGIVLPAIYFPLHGLAEMDLPVSPELALSIARRESEFNHVIGSPVGALGLMQLMPATAKEVAGWMGLPYSRNRLTSDWAYNAQLGSRYLEDLIETFGPSPVMIAAGYNAGPSRPRTWMAERGDPRIGRADIIDWIEHIPFNETRNYVMRVSESIPIYQARLTGETGRVDFLSLLIGRPPFVRPQARGGDAAATPVAVAAPPPSMPAVDIPTTPQARPAEGSDSPHAPLTVDGVRPPQRPRG